MTMHKLTTGPIAFMYVRNTFDFTYKKNTLWLLQIWTYTFSAVKNIKYYK